MRLILLGSGEFALPTFEHLRQRHQVVAVVSQPDRPAGRGRKLQPTAVASWAAQRQLFLLTPPDANIPDVVARLGALRPDVSVVIAFGQKLSPGLLEALGPLSINLHASLLPRFRGAAPINWAILAGDSETGLSVISLAQRMDAGLIYAQCRTPIDPLETAGELHDRLAAMGPKLIDEVLGLHAQGRLRGQPQDESLATKAPKLTKADATVDFTADSTAVRCRIHGLTPWPGVTVTVRQDQDDSKTFPLKLLRVKSLPDAASSACLTPGTVVPSPSSRRGLAVVCGCGLIELLEVQPPGSRPMPIADFLRGHPISAGATLQQ